MGLPRLLGLASSLSFLIVPEGSLEFLKVPFSFLEFLRVPDSGFLWGCSIGTIS